MKGLLKLSVLLFITGVHENVPVFSLPLFISEIVPTLKPEQNFCENKVNGTLLPYPYDCDWYIRCEDQGFIIKRCEEGRHFNAILQLCDYPEYAGCSASAYPTEPSTSPVTEIIPTMNPVDSPCENKANGTLLPYPYDCDWYIRCEDHAAIVLRCEKERQFNALLQICDYPEIAQCIAVPYPTTTEKPPPTPTPEGPTLIIPGEDACNGKVNGTLLPYPFDCDWYIRCEDSDAKLHRCREHRQFNDFFQICDYPENAKCMASAYPTTEPSTTPMTPPPSVSNVCCGVENGTLLAYPGESSQYIQCLYPIPVALKCDDGLQFNSKSQSCEYPKVRITGRQSTPTATCKDKADGTLLPFSEDCKKYYFCSNGEEVLLPCTIGSIYDAVIGNCVPGDVCP